MYLRKVSLRNWGCHDALTVEFGPGLNVCVGHNGAGKSTLYQAILTALTVKYNSTSQEIVVLKSWGKDGFGPSVALDVARSEGDWRLSKTYIHEAICTLEREGRGEHLKNQQAEQTLGAWREDDGAAGRLMLELWSAQNDPMQVFDPGEKPRTQTRAHLIERIIERAGRSEVSGSFARMKKTVAEHYDKFFTSKRSGIKAGSDLERARKSLRDAEERFGLLRQRQGEMETKSAAHAARSAEHEDACRARDALRRARTDRARRAAEYRDKAEALNEAKQCAAVLRQRFQEQDAEHQRFVKVEQDIHRAEAALHDLVPTLHDAEARSSRAEGALSVAAPRVATALESLDSLAFLFERRTALAERIDREESRAAEYDAARAAFEQAGCAAERAVADLEAAQAESVFADRVREAVARAARRLVLEQAETVWRQAEAEYRRAEACDLSAHRDRLRGRLRLVRGWLLELEALAPARDGGPIPSDREIKELRRDDDLLASQSETLEADALTVRFAPSTPLQAEFSGDGAPPETHDLGPGQIIERRSWTGFTLEIAGVGRIEVGRSSVGPTARLEQWRSGRAQLADRLREWQAPTVAVLEERRGRDRDRRDLQARVALQLDGKTVPELEAELAELDRRLAELGIGPDDPAPPVPSSSLAALRKQRDEADRRRAAAQAVCQADESPSLADNLPEPAEADRRAAEARKQLAVAEKRCKDAERARVRAESDLKNVGENLRLAEQDLAVEAHGEDPRDQLSQIDGEIQAARATLAQFNAQVVGEQTRASVQVVKSKLTKELEGARDERESALAALNEWKQKSIAAQTLLDNLNRHRDELRQAAARDGKAETREDDLKRSREDCQEAEAEVKLRQKALPADPNADAEEFDTRWKQAEADCQKGEVELASLGGELTTLGSEGLDTELVLAEEAYDRCRRHEADVQREAASWAVLHHLLREVEANQSRQVAEQVAALSGRMVDRLTGGNADGVTFDGSSLVPLEARAPRAGLSAKLDRFSRGTREQVALACRLQIGLLLGRQFRHMLLLDDPLAHTDPARHAAALDVLEELAETLQLIIFTCHADRYRPLWDRDRTRRIEIGDEMAGKS